MSKASVTHMVDKKIVKSTGPVVIADAGGHVNALTIVGVSYKPRKMDKFHRDARALRSGTVDASVQAFLLGADGKVISEPGLVYYNQPKFEDSVVELVPVGPLSDFHSTINMKLNCIPEGVERIRLVSSVHEAKQRGHHIGIFGVMALYIVDAGKKPLTIQLYEGFGFGAGAVVLGDLFVADGKWQFQASGDIIVDGLPALCSEYGIEVKEEEASAQSAA